MKGQTLTRLLNSMTVTYDTREQMTYKLQQRLNAIEVPTQRRMLQCGDYSCCFTMADGMLVDYSRKLCIERKMSIDELAMCFTSERVRFEREFERAADMGIQMILLVEDCTWNKIYAHDYRSGMTARALVASIQTFRSRYNLQTDFCPAEMSGIVIRDTLYYAAMNDFRNMEQDEIIERFCMPMEGQEECTKNAEQGRTP